MGLEKLVTQLQTSTTSLVGEQYAHSIAIIEKVVYNGCTTTLTKEGNNERPLETDSHSCAGDTGCCAHSKPFRLQQERAANCKRSTVVGEVTQNTSHTGIDRRGTTLSVPV